MENRFSNHRQGVSEVVEKVATRSRIELQTYIEQQLRKILTAAMLTTLVMRTQTMTKNDGCGGGRNRSNWTSVGQTDIGQTAERDTGGI